MPNITMTTTALTLDQANTIFQNTIGHRSQVLNDRKSDPKAYREYLETRIEELGRIENPTEGDIETVERFIRYWEACNLLCTERERLQRDRQNRLRSLIKDFEEMKNAK